MLNIEIREVVPDEEATTEIMAPTTADNLEHARKLALETAESQKCRVRLFIVGSDGHFHEPVQDGNDIFPVKHILATIIEAMPKKLELVYIDYRDQLTEEQIRMVLNDDMEGFWEDTDEWVSEQQHHAIHLLLEELCDEIEDAVAILNDDEAWETFRETCYERDESTWFDDLMRNTPGVMVRYDLDHEVESHMVGESDVEDQALDIAEAAGIDYEDNKKALCSLVLNASYGGMLCVLHRSDIADVVSVNSGGTVIFTDPMLLVYDGLNGSGHMEQIVGEITVNVIPDDTLRLDAGRFSWSDDIAGIVHSCADTPVKFIKPADNKEEANNG